MVLLLAIWFIPSARAQNSENRYSADGFAFFSVDRPAGASLGDIVTGGIGGEALLYKGLGFGLDLGYQFPPAHPADGVGLLSVNGCYHLMDNRLDRGRFVPFVTGGYGLAFRSGRLNLYNFGGGATYWFHRHLGVRFELRDYRHKSYGDYAMALRFGLSFK